MTELTRQIARTKGLTNLTEITADDLANYTSIDDEAFYDCRSLTSITIPNSVNSIGYYAFEECVNLNRVLSNFSKAELVAKGLPETCRVTVSYTHLTLPTKRIV